MGRASYIDFLLCSGRNGVIDTSMPQLVSRERNADPDLDPRILQGLLNSSILILDSETFVAVAHQTPQYRKVKNREGFSNFSNCPTEAGCSSGLSRLRVHTHDGDQVIRL
jgi:hypothetical protein